MSSNLIAAAAVMWLVLTAVLVVPAFLPGHPAPDPDTWENGLAGPRDT